MEIEATSALDLCLTFIDQNVLKGKRARNSKQVRCKGGWMHFSEILVVLDELIYRN